MALSNLDIQNAKNNFRKLHPLYKDFTTNIALLLKERIKNGNVKDAFVKWRTKDESSFIDKMTRTGKDYKNPLKDITDISGIRIIVYYQTQLSIFEEIVEEEFKVDIKKSRDASESLEDNAFGYLSIHKIVMINEKKKKDLTWNKFDGLWAEIQIRTSLQDAWATISHNSQYKVESLIPPALRRKMSMLAGIFELADDQFIEIQKESENIQALYLRKQNSGDKNMPVVYESLTQFFKSSAIVIGAVNLQKHCLLLKLIKMYWSITIMLILI